MNKKNLLLLLAISGVMVDTARATRWWREDDMGVGGPAIVKSGSFANERSSWRVLSPDNGSDEARKEVEDFSIFMARQTEGEGQCVTLILGDESIVVKLIQDGKERSMTFMEADFAKEVVGAYLKRSVHQEVRDPLNRLGKHTKRPCSMESRGMKKPPRAEDAALTASAVSDRSQIGRELSWSPDPIDPNMLK